MERVEILLMRSEKITDGAEDNKDIKDERTIFYVIDVIFEFGVRFVERCRGFVVDLSPSGEAGFYYVADLIMWYRGILLGEFHSFGSWTGE